MLFPVIVVVVAVGLGTVLGVVPSAGARHIGPVRTFALTAALSVVALHLLPEAAAALGWWAIAGLFLGFSLPACVEWLARSAVHASAGRTTLALEIGYAGLVVHSVGDGLSMGAFSGALGEGNVHADVVLAVAAHTVPLTTMFVLGFAEARGRRSALLRAAGLAAATLAGIAATALVPAGSLHAAKEWVAAIVSGLLIEVVFDDLREHPPQDVASRTLDFCAAAAGISISLVGDGHVHAVDAGGDSRARLLDTLIALTLDIAPVLLLGLAAGAVVQLLGPGAPGRGARATGRLAQAGAGAVSGARVPLCSCGVVPAAFALDARGAAPAFVVAFLLAAPGLRAETFLITGRFFGWKVAGVRLGAALLAAVIAGIAASFLLRRKGGEPSGALPESPARSATPSFERFIGAFDELLFHTGAWTAVGLITAAFADTLLPSRAAGAHGALELLIVSAVSIPVYFCASSATPLGAVLVAKGFSPGALLAALLIGPSASATTLSFVARRFGRPAAALALAAALAVAWSSAVFVNALLPDAASITRAVLAERERGPLAVGSAALLVLLLARGVWRAGMRGWLAVMQGPPRPARLAEPAR